VLSLRRVAAIFGHLALWPLFGPRFARSLVAGTAAERRTFSSSTKEQGMISQEDRPAANDTSERGKRGSFDRQSGAVHGSGSGAGGGGNPDEDYDQDAAAGAAAEPVGGPRPRDRAVDRPIDRHEGR
jgi:hypothetical protein